jgi:hypothetical protein
MLRKCISSYLKIDDKTGHVGFAINIQLFPHPVAANFDPSDRNIHQRCNLFGRNIEPKVSTQTELFGCKVRIGYF